MLHELKLGSVFATNMESVECEYIELIKDFRTLKERCMMLNPFPNKKGIKRLIMHTSELADFVPRDQPWNNIDFIKELQKVRKYGLSVIADSIDRVDKRVLNENHFHGYFRKYNKADPTVATYYDWMTGEVIPLRNIPRTTIPFDTYESASFYMEPQGEELGNLPLNKEHEIVKLLLEKGSIKETGLHTQEVKRARDSVLEYHMKHCLHKIEEKK